MPYNMVIESYKPSAHTQTAYNDHYNKQEEKMDIKTRQYFYQWQDIDIKFHFLDQITVLQQTIARKRKGF